MKVYPVTIPQEHHRVIVVDALGFPHHDAHLAPALRVRHDPREPAPEIAGHRIPEFHLRAEHPVFPVEPARILLPAGHRRPLHAMIPGSPSLKRLPCVVGHADRSVALQLDGANSAQVRPNTREMCSGSRIGRGVPVELLVLPVKRLSCRLLMSFSFHPSPRTLAG